MIKSILQSIFATVSLLLFSCSEDTIEYPTIEDGVEMSFVVDNETRVVSTPFQTGRFLTVYAYQAGRNPKNTRPVATQEYKSVSPGTVVSTGDPMLLGPGNYDFYAVSSNSLPDATPSFRNGVSSTLKYNTDYLWDKIPNVSVVRNQPKTNTILFAHTYSQISIEVFESFFTFIHDVEYASLRLRNRRPTMTLSNGKIKLNSTGSLFNLPMKLNEYTATAIVPPQNKATTITCFLRVWINFHLYSSTFEVDIPFPQGIKPGLNYKFEVVIKDESIFFSNRDSIPLQ